MTRLKVLCFLIVAGLWASPAQAAIGVTSLAASTANFTSNTVVLGTSGVTGTYTPGTNHLILATVVVRYASTPGTGGVLTMSGCGLTWVRVQELVFPTGDVRLLAVFRALGGSPTTGAITVTDSSGHGPVDATWIVGDVSGTDTTGTNGSGAVGTPTTGVNTGTGSITLTIPGSPAAGDATVVMLGTEDAVHFTSDGNFTTLATVSTGLDATQRLDYDLGHHTGNTSSIDAPAAAFGAIGVLIKAPGGATPAPPPGLLLLGAGSPG